MTDTTQSLSIYPQTDFIWSSPFVLCPVALLSIIVVLGIPRFYLNRQHSNELSSMRRSPLNTLAKFVFVLNLIVMISFILDAINIVSRAIIDSVWTSYVLAFYTGASWIAWMFSLALLMNEVHIHSKWNWIQNCYWITALANESSIAWLWTTAFLELSPETQFNVYDQCLMGVFIFRFTIEVIIVVLSSIEMFTGSKHRVNRLESDPLITINQSKQAATTTQTNYGTTTTTTHIKTTTTTTIKETFSVSETWRKSKKLFPFFWPQNSLKLQIHLIMCLLLILAGLVVDLVIPIKLGYIVDNLKEGDFSWKPIFIYIGLKFLQGGSGLLQSLEAWFWIPISQHTTREISLKMFSHLHSLSLGYHINRKTGEVLSIMDRGTTSVVTLINQLLFQIFPVLASIVIISVYSTYRYAPPFGFILLFTMTLYIYVTIRMSEWRSKFRRTTIEKDDAVQSRAVDSLLNFETVKYHNTEDFEIQRYKTAIMELQDADWKNIVTLNILNLIQNAIITSGLLMASLLFAWEVARDGLSSGDFVAFNMYMMQLYTPLHWFGAYYRITQSTFIDMEKMLIILEENQSIKDLPDAKELQVYDGHVVFDNVTFAYDERQTALKGISFSVAKGSTVALVGPSGGGKSTILRLLFRFYDPDSGHISIDGQDIKKVTQSSLRKSIGVVPQDTVLFNDTIYYNIYYGNIEADETQVKKAAEAAQIHRKIESFPDGYDTIVGERGLRLSGGEKQRVAIARTILKNPPIIVLDEATSALDTNTERQIQSALYSMTKDRTTLIIAHRLSTICNADSILVIDDGVVAEQGTHEDLIRNGAMGSGKGLYYDMWQKQLHDDTDFQSNHQGESKSSDSLDSKEPIITLASSVTHNSEVDDIKTEKFENKSSWNTDLDEKSKVFSEDIFNRIQQNTYAKIDKNKEEIYESEEMTDHASESLRSFQSTTSSPEGLEPTNIKIKENKNIETVNSLKISHPTSRPVIAKKIREATSREASQSSIPIILVKTDNSVNHINSGLEANNVLLADKPKEDSDKHMRVIFPFKAQATELLSREYAGSSMIKGDNQEHTRIFGDLLLKTDCNVPIKKANDDEKHEAAPIIVQSPSIVKVITSTTPGRNLITMVPQKNIPSTINTPLSMNAIAYDKHQISTNSKNDSTVQNSELTLSVIEPPELNIETIEGICVTANDQKDVSVPSYTSSKGDNVTQKDHKFNPLNIISAPKVYCRDVVSKEIADSSMILTKDKKNNFLFNALPSRVKSTDVIPDIDKDLIKKDNLEVKFAAEDIGSPKAIADTVTETIMDSHIDIVKNPMEVFVLESTSPNVDPVTEAFNDQKDMSVAVDAAKLPPANKNCKYNKLNPLNILSAPKVYHNNAVSKESADSGMILNEHKKNTFLYSTVSSKVETVNRAPSKGKEYTKEVKSKTKTKLKKVESIVADDIVNSVTKLKEESQCAEANGLKDLSVLESKSPNVTETIEENKCDTVNNQTNVFVTVTSTEDKTQLTLDNSNHRDYKFNLLNILSVPKIYHSDAVSKEFTESSMILTKQKNTFLSNAVTCKVETVNMVSKKDHQRNEEVEFETMFETEDSILANDLANPVTKVAEESEYVVSSDQKYMSVLESVFSNVPESVAESKSDAFNNQKDAFVPATPIVDSTELTPASKNRKDYKFNLLNILSAPKVYHSDAVSKEFAESSMILNEHKKDTFLFSTTTSKVKTANIGPQKCKQFIEEVKHTSKHEAVDSIFSSDIADPVTEAMTESECATAYDQKDVPVSESRLPNITEAIEENKSNKVNDKKDIFVPTTPASENRKDYKFCPPNIISAPKVHDGDTVTKEVADSSMTLMDTFQSRFSDSSITTADLISRKNEECIKEDDPQTKESNTAVIHKEASSAFITPLLGNANESKPDSLRKSDDTKKLNIKPPRMASPSITAPMELPAAETNHCSACSTEIHKGVLVKSRVETFEMMFNQSRKDSHSKSPQNMGSSSKLEGNDTPPVNVRKRIEAPIRAVGAPQYNKQKTANNKGQMTEESPIGHEDPKEDNHYLSKLETIELDFESMANKPERVGSPSKYYTIELETEEIEKIDSQQDVNQNMFTSSQLRLESIELLLNENKEYSKQGKHKSMPMGVGSLFRIDSIELDTDVHGELDAGFSQNDIHGNTQSIELIMDDDQGSTKYGNYRSASLRVGSLFRVDSIEIEADDYNENLNEDQTNAHQFEDAPMKVEKIGLVLNENKTRKTTGTYDTISMKLGPLFNIGSLRMGPDKTNESRYENKYVYGPSRVETLELIWNLPIDNDMWRQDRTAPTRTGSLFRVDTIELECDDIDECGRPNIPSPGSSEVQTMELILTENKPTMSMKVGSQFKIGTIELVEEDMDETYSIQSEGRLSVGSPSRTKSVELLAAEGTNHSITETSTMEYSSSKPGSFSELAHVLSNVDDTEIAQVFINTEPTTVEESVMDILNISTSNTDTTLESAVDLIIENYLDICASTMNKTIATSEKRSPETPDRAIVDQVTRTDSHDSAWIITQYHNGQIYPGESTPAVQHILNQTETVNIVYGHTTHNIGISSNILHPSESDLVHPIQDEGTLIQFQDSTDTHIQSVTEGNITEIEIAEYPMTIVHGTTERMVNADTTCLLTEVHDMNKSYHSIHSHEITVDDGVSHNTNSKKKKKRKKSQN